MRYCLIDHEPPKERMNAVHFFQWANVFGVKVTVAQQEISSLSDGKHDLLHVLLCRRNVQWIKKMRQVLGEKSATRIVLTLDVPRELWEHEFGSEGALKQVAELGDVLTATDFDLSQELASVTGIKTYELPHPADIGRLKSLASGIVTESDKFIDYLRAGVVMIKHVFGLRKTYSKINERIALNDESAWIAYLRDNKLIADTEDNIRNSAFCICAAALGCLVIGFDSTDALRRCYPFTSIGREDAQSVRNLHCWLQAEKAPRNFYVENARNKVEYYNWGNMLHRFFTVLAHSAPEITFHLPVADSRNTVVFHERIKRVSGPRSVTCRRNEFILVCLLKNGREYIRSFMRHYNDLGCRHFYFIDNGSTDGTMEMLGEYSDVTLYQTDLAHKDYENEIRRTIIEEQANCWCLCVDIDELFDYPFSQVITMQQLLDYLNQNNYTAAAAYMLDMFSREVNFSDKQNSEDEDLKSVYTYYDISNVVKKPYFSENISTYLHNKLSNNRIEKYYGGIRRARFSTKESEYLLLKHPLVYVNGLLEPVTTPHYCDNATVADITTLIRHYKFTHKFREKVNRSVQDGVYTYYAQKEYQAYHKVVKDSDTLSLYSSSTSRQLNNINQLVDEGFLIVSESYLRYAGRCTEKQYIETHQESKK